MFIISRSKMWKLCLLAPCISGQDTQPFNPLEWFICNFSLQYPHSIEETGSENTQTYQVEVLILIWQQILVTYLQGNG